MDLSTNIDMRYKLKKRLILEEGYRQFPYKDTHGKLTIGYGRCLDTNGINQDEALYLLNNDIDKIENELIKNIKFYDSLDDARKLVLIDMSFQMGIYGVLGFVQFLKALENKDYDTASKEMLNSIWGKEFINRANDLAFIMET